MKIKNNTSGIIAINDMGGGQSGQSLILQPGAEVVVYDEDAEKSPSLASYLTSGAITKTGTEEPSTGTPVENQPEVIGEHQIIITGAAPTAGMVLVAISATGAQWRVGGSGTQGPAGPQGPTGVGAQGPQGATGSQGFQGATGSQGFQGADGAQGPQGEQGPQGA